MYKHLIRATVKEIRQDDKVNEQEIDEIVTLEQQISQVTGSGYSGTVQDFSARFSYTIWLELFKNMFKTSSEPITEQTRVQVQRGDHLETISKLFKQRTPRQLANYLGWRAALFLAPHSNLNFRANHFKFENATLYKVEQQAAVNQSCLQFTSEFFPFALGSMYYKSYFGSVHMNDALTMFKELRDAFSAIIEQSSWMCGDTKQTALRKLELMSIEIGMPSGLNDSAKLDKYYAKVRDDWFMWTVT